MFEALVHHYKTFSFNSRGLENGNRYACQRSDQMKHGGGGVMIGCIYSNRTK